jgi:transposase
VRAVRHVVVGGEDAEPERHQATQFPRITPAVTEARRHGLWCVACGARTQAAWPATMPGGSFGPHVQAAVGYVTEWMGARHREIQELLATLCQTEVSVGSITALEQAVRTALATPVAEAMQYVQRQSVRNAEETRWREKTKRGWFWMSVTPLVTSLRLLKTHGVAGAKEVVGEEVGGTIGTWQFRGPRSRRAVNLSPREAEHQRPALFFGARLPSRKIGRKR